MEIIHYKGENFKDIINKGLVLVDFYADWCGPCKMLAPILEELQDEIQIIKINIDNHEDLAREFKIMSIPTIVVFKEGREIDKMVGFREKEELEDKIRELK